MTASTPWNVSPDEEMNRLLGAERERQATTLQLIASENFVFFFFF